MVETLLSLLAYFYPNTTLHPLSLIHCYTLYLCSAGEIVPFLKERVHQVCSLQLVHTLGLTGVMSQKLREVWVFRNTQAPLPLQPSLASSGLSSRRKEWISQLTNPPLRPRDFSVNIRGQSSPTSFVLLDDGAHCVGGTKQRLLGTRLLMILIRFCR